MTMADSARRLVSFVVPVRDDAVRLERCLTSIRRSAYPPELVEIVVADNGSTDRSADVGRGHGAIVLELPGKRLGALRNAAAAAARGDVLAFVDADHEIVPGWIAAATRALENPDVAAVGAACVPPVPATWVQRLYDRLRSHPSRIEPVEWLGTGNMAVKRTAFDAVAGFDTTLETCEDVDLCRKLRGRGLTLLADPELGNIHYGDPRTLKHVFFGELWRGRDNVRVSFRAPRSARTITSAVIPVVHLLLLLTTVAGVLSFQRIGYAIAGLALFLFVASILARTLRMNVGLPEWPRAVAVATAYELGRTFAVTGWSPYRLRRKAAAADA